MLRLALLFLVIALVAAFFGFGSIVSTAVHIAVILFWVFIILFLISLVFGGVRRRW